MYISIFIVGIIKKGMCFPAPENISMSSYSANLLICLADVDKMGGSADFEKPWECHRQCTEVIYCLTLITTGAHIVS